MKKDSFGLLFAFTLLCWGEIPVHAFDFYFPMIDALPGSSGILHYMEKVDLPPDTTAVYELTDEDYERVANELNIEIATMKAVVEVEAGNSHQGFAAPGIPLVNFDQVLFKRFMRRSGKSIAQYTGAPAFLRPNIRKYGSLGKAHWARLESARKIDREIAEKATFWGMFQIGGFNWKQCGAASLSDFVERMSLSEAAQLELFARFITKNNLVKYLRAKNWAGFAYHYNGPRYKARGYHTRLARAYRKFASAD